MEPHDTYLTKWIASPFRETFGITLNNWMKLFVWFFFWGGGHVLRDVMAPEPIVTLRIKTDMFMWYVK